MRDVKLLTQEEFDDILREHELMRRTLEVISGSASDQLQATQARGALANIGPAITISREGDRAGG